MKKLFCRLLSIALVLCLCMALTACGAPNAASGLGTLTMDNDDKDSGGIGTLGEPTDSDEPGEPAPQVPTPQEPGPQAPTPQEPAPQEPSPNNGDAVFSSTQQDFSFLYDKNYIAKWDDQSGATIYTEHVDSIPFVLVFCNHRGDTAGFDITNYFYFDIEDTKQMLGSRLISVKDDITLTIGSKNVPGVLYTYMVDEHTVEMLRVLDDTGDSLMLYSAKYLQGQGDATLAAMVKAMTSLQLDADYYTDGGGTGTDTQTPPQAPAPTALSTEPYECQYFTVNKPTGWEVFYEVIDAGGGVKRLCAFVYDPANPNDVFFFVHAIEQFYVSESSKQLWLPYMPAYFSNAPVLSGDPTAEATLAAWGNIFAMLSAEGTKSSTYLRNYALTKVIESKVLNSTTATGTTSYVLGTVTIPGAAEQSLMLFQNTLMLMNGVAPLPASAQYYISYCNLGVVLRQSVAGSQFDTVRACLESFDPTSFVNSYSSRSSTPSGKIALPKTDVSSLY